MSFPEMPMEPSDGSYGSTYSFTQLTDSNSVNNFRTFTDDTLRQRRRRSLTRRSSRHLDQINEGGDEVLGAMSGKKWEFSWETIIPHNSRFKLRWDQFIGILILYTVIEIPLEIAFNPIPEDVNLGTDIFVTIGFFINILINFRTSIEFPTETVTNPQRIAEIYLKKWFWLDLIATVPWDRLFSPVLGSNSVGFTIVRLLRLARVTRLLSHNRFNLYYSATAMRLFKLLSYALCTAHWLGCAWYFLSEVEGYGEEPFGIRPGREFFEETTLGFRYYKSLHWGIWGLLSIGSELNPQTEAQITLTLVVIFAGVYVFATIIGNIEVLLAQSAASSMRFQEHVQALNDFFHHHHLPPRLRVLIMRHTHHFFRTRGGLDDRELLSGLPSEVRAKVYRRMYKRELKKCRFFIDCDESFIDELCLHVRPQVALRGDLVIRQGSLGSEMYIIHRGEAEAVDIDTGDVHSMIPQGRFFGEISLLTSNRRSISVRAKTKMELYVLHREQFLKVLQHFPEEEARFISVANERLKKTEDLAETLDREQEKESPWNREFIKNLLDGNEELQDILDSPEVVDFMKRFDTNGDGEIDEHEQYHIIEFLKSKAEQMRAIRAQHPSKTLTAGSAAGYENGDCCHHGDDHNHSHFHHDNHGNHYGDAEHNEQLEATQGSEIVDPRTRSPHPDAQLQHSQSLHSAISVNHHQLQQHQEQHHQHHSNTHHHHAGDHHHVREHRRSLTLRARNLAMHHGDVLSPAGAILPSDLLLPVDDSPHGYSTTGHSFEHPTSPMNLRRTEGNYSDSNPVHLPRSPSHGNDQIHLVDGLQQRITHIQDQIAELSFTLSQLTSPPYQYQHHEHGRRYEHQLQFQDGDRQHTCSTSPMEDTNGLRCPETASIESKSPPHRSNEAPNSANPPVAHTQEEKSITRYHADDEVDEYDGDGMENEEADEKEEEESRAALVNRANSSRIGLSPSIHDVGRTGTDATLYDQSRETGVHRHQGPLFRSLSYDEQ